MRPSRKVGPILPERSSADGNSPEEALWLGRLVARLLPGEPEVLGLLALMLHLEARRGARRDHQGGYIPLDEQDPSKWDAMRDPAKPRTSCSVQAIWGASAATSSKAPCNPPMAIWRFGRAPDWTVLETLYDALLVITGSPVVAINRAMVVAEAQGPKEGLAILCDVESDPRLSQYQPYWAARAELLARCGQAAAADQAYAARSGWNLIRAFAGSCKLKESAFRLHRPFRPVPRS